MKKWNLVKEISFIALSFIIPFAILIILFTTNGFAMNSYKGNTVMMIDMQSQYIAYMKDFKHILINRESLIYTTEKAFGGDYLSIFTYYLGSPFNLFVIFFKDEAIPLFFLWSSLIKMCFASVNFYLLTRFTSKFTYQKIIFAIGYGLISYSFIYLSNFMWLDGVMILPLVVLGLHFLKEKKHYWLYPLALAYSLMTSWYIGFMTCVFMVLYFFYLFIAKFDRENGEFYKFIIRFTVFSLVGGFLASSYWLTAFLHLSGTKGFMELPKNKFFSLSMLISGFLENNYANNRLITQYNSYISMFVGVVPLVFAITFFFNKEFKLKDRLAMLGVLLIYLIFSLDSVTTALLHGGKEPTWFPGRYSFIIGFLVCLAASRSLDEAHKLHPLYYFAPLVIGVGGYLIVNYTTHSERLEKYPVSAPSAIMFFITILFGVIISIIYRYNFQKLDGEKVRKYIPYALPLLLVVQIFSLYRGGDNVLKVNKESNSYQDYSVYSEDVKYSRIIDAVKEYEKENDNDKFYRMETTFNRPGNYNQINNNPFFYSYSGVSTFSSSGKKDVESYLSKIGFHYNGFFTKYDGGSTYAINSLLGIKYLVEDKEASSNIHPYFLEYNTFHKIEPKDGENAIYYQNPDALSLGFLSDKSGSYFINEGNRAESGNVYWFDHFEYQNSMFKTLNKSIGEDIFYPLQVESISTSLIYTTDEFGIRTYKDVKKGSSIRITYSTPIEGIGSPIYFSEKNYTADCYYILNGKSMPINTYWNKGIFSVKDTTNHLHTLNITFNQDRASVTIRPELYYENVTVLRKYLNAAKEGEFIIDEIDNTLTKKAYRGHIDLADKQNKDLIFTLPNEKGISVYIDGKKANIYTKFNIFTAVDISKLDAGRHEVTIQYVDKGLVASLPLSITTFLGFVPLVIFYNKIETKAFKKKERKK